MQSEYACARCSASGGKVRWPTARIVNDALVYRFERVCDKCWKGKS